MTVWIQMYRYMLLILWEFWEVMYAFLQRHMFMPHNFKEGRFPFQYPQGTLSNLLLLFAKGLACKMEHHHHFSSYLTVCLPDWDRILLLYLATFSSSLAFGDFSKDLFGLVLSGATTSHFNIFCGCLCCLSISWPKFFLWFKSWARGSALELVSFTVSEVSSDVRTRQLL